MASISEKPALSAYINSQDSMPVLFIKTLFEPFIFSPQTYWNTFQNSIEILQQNGITETIRKIGRAIKNHPADTFTLAGSFLLGNVSGAEQSPALLLAVATTSAVRNSKSLARTIDVDGTSQTLGKFIGTKINGDSIASLKINQRAVEKVISVALYSSIGLFAIFSLTPVAAVEMDKWKLTVTALKDHYSGGPCGRSIGEAIEPSLDCLKREGAFEVCQDMVPRGYTSDGIVYTHHDTEVVTIVERGEQTCYLAAKRVDVPVVKTCFTDVQNLEGQTVELLPQITLADAHKGLPVGNSVQHIAIHQGQKSCAVFHDTIAKPVELNHAVCLLTSPQAGGEVIQTCFDPDHPTSITVKPLQGLRLNSPSGDPISIVITDPKSLGLNPSVAPELQNPCKCDVEPVKKEII